MKKKSENTNQVETKLQIRKKETNLKYKKISVNDINYGDKMQKPKK